MDTTARDDNPEEVVGAWQRALAQEGLTAGRFYCIYNPDVAVTIEDEALRSRYESKRDHDLGEIHNRIQGVGVERAYRITGALEKMARQIEEKTVPLLIEYKTLWRKMVLWGDAMIGGWFLVAGIAFSHWLGFMDGWKPVTPDWWQDSPGSIPWSLAFIFVVAGLFAYLHFKVRKFAAGRVLKLIDKQFTPGIERSRLRRAFKYNAGIWHSVFRKAPVGWGKRGRKRLQRIIAEANRYIQTLNDSFTDPSGDMTPRAEATNPPLSVVGSIATAKSAAGDATHS